MNRIHDSLVGALIYPAFLMVVAVVVIGIIMVFAVPVFTDMFASMSVELLWPTRALIAMSDFFQKFWLLLVGLRNGAEDIVFRGWAWYNFFYLG